MKTTFLSCFCSVALALTAWGQAPTPPSDPAAAVAAPSASTAPAADATPPVATAPSTPAVTATIAPVAPVAPTAAPTASPDTEDEFDKAIEKKIRKHFAVDFGSGDHGGDDVPWVALPIVIVVFLAVFGTPIAVVGLIMYFSFSKSRAMHKTVRMMVEKGQPVPEALLNPPPVIRQRSDLRRGVVLLMVGAGLMVFFGACNDWEGGAWSLGIIPFLIGLGYLLVWKLDVNRSDASPKV
ncbi:MAG: DUF6249 domain-containing protein [Verrucomicrobiota bacterium]|nr:DUF6249 domain-containing protein [Verrucomicrobiota bacterium]